MDFTDEIDRYVVLKLALADYRPGGAGLPSGFRLAGGEARRALRAQEKNVLRRLFRRWRVPYHGLLPGWRHDSPLYALEGGRLAGGLFLCDDNEFGIPRWGQIHYVYTDPAYQGRGVYRAAFAQAVARARAWGLEGLVLNSDRHLLPEVYVRWGATPYRTIAKGERRSRLAAAGRLARVVAARLRKAITKDNPTP